MGEVRGLGGGQVVLKPCAPLCHNLPIPRFQEKKLKICSNHSDTVSQLIKTRIFELRLDKK